MQALAATAELTTQMSAHRFAGAPWAWRVTRDGVLECACLTSLGLLARQPQPPNSVQPQEVSHADLVGGG